LFFQGEDKTLNFPIFLADSIALHMIVDCSEASTDFLIDGEDSWYKFHCLAGRVHGDESMGRGQHEGAGDEDAGCVALLGFAKRADKTDAVVGELHLDLAADRLSPVLLENHLVPGISHWSIN
jgi:hypothetical protein